MSSDDRYSVAPRSLRSRLSTGMIVALPLWLCTSLVSAPASARVAVDGVAREAPLPAGPARADLPRSGQGPAKSPARRIARKSGKRQNDPSDSDSDTTGQSTNAKARKGKTGDDSAAKSSGGKSGADKPDDSLDSLMSDVVSENKASKGKKRDNKEMDSLLKDVQKSDPAPVVKKEAPPAAAPPLSPAEIATAMGQLKVRANACARRLGRAGTAELKITVSKEGKVTEVKVGGKLAGTPVAACIEQAAMTATFRPNAGLRFDYRMDVR